MLLIDFLRSSRRERQAVHDGRQHGMRRCVDAHKLASETYEMREHEADASTCLHPCDLHPLPRHRHRRTAAATVPASSAASLATSSAWSTASKSCAGAGSSRQRLKLVRWRSQPSFWPAEAPASKRATVGANDAENEP
jgi:hypothetical protein